MEEPLDARAEDFLTPRSLKNILLRFMLPECYEDVNWSALGFDGDDVMTDGGIEILTKLLRSDRKLRMYGSAEHLSTVLRKYRAFPSANTYFELMEEDPYNHGVRKYLVNDGHFFWSKHDYLVKLQSDMLIMFPTIKKFPRQFAVICFKQIEKMVGETIEYIPERDNEENLVDVYEIMEEYVELVYRDWDALREEQVREYYFPHDHTDFEMILESFKQFYPEEWDDTALKRCLRQFIEEHPPHEQPWNYADVFYTCKILMEFFEEIVLNYPHMFKPYAGSEVRSPVTLRVFMYNTRRIVLTTDLTAVINQKFEVNERCRLTENYALSIDLGEILERYEPNYLEGIFIVFYALKRPGRLQPVRFMNGGFCFPTTMVFVDVMKRVILGWKLFQRLNKNNAKRVMDQFLVLLKTVFNTEENCFTFIKRAPLEEFILQLQKFCEPFQKVRAEEVPDLQLNKPMFKKDLQVIVNKLLSKNVFPSRDQQLDTIHKILIEEVKTPKNWRINNVYDLLEQMQCNAFVMMNRELLDFYSSQGS